MESTGSANHRFSALDYAAAMERVGGDATLLREIARLFLDEYPGLLKSLKQAVSEGQADGLYRAAHTLKGSLGTLGAYAAFQSAQHLETMGRNSDLSEAGAGLLAFEDLLRRLDTELRELAR